MKKQLIIILFLSFIQGIIHNFGHPVTPALVTSLQIPNYMFGVFFASMSLGLMIGSPLWGFLGDLGNKKLYITLGLILYSVGQAAFAYVGNMYWMIFFRFLSGFGVSASMTLLLSYVIDISDKKDRAKHLAFLAALITLGASIGYGIGGFLTENNFFVTYFGTSDLRRVFLIQAILNLFYTLLVILLIKGMNQKNLDFKKPKIRPNFKGIKSMNSTLLLFLISLSFISIGSINLSKYIDVYFNELGYTPSQLGTFVMVTGFVSVVSSILIVPLIVKLKHELVVITIIQILSVIIILFVFRQVKFLFYVYTVFMLYVILKAIYQPYEQNFISSFAKEGATASIMGVRQAFLSIGMIIGPLLGGFLYEIKPLLVFDVSAGMFFIGFVLLLYILIKQKSKKAVSNI
ncbi:MAG: MFS transporter [Firmicutes bacterium]|nr:MFS transporter [Bacillota bacterium]